jgi:hypothetical protein
MKNSDQIRLRIESGKFKSEDIKHPDRLTEDQIASIPVEQVFCWSRTGAWKEKDFKKWCKVMCIID